MDDEEHNSVFGDCPEFGAIFISNNATKKECLRRKIFALPSSKSHFVKQVKAGMILFLFEFERKELHGVFQACSDGAMNIVPHAFGSSGKQFPAQVKVTAMWNCRPLSENEFRDAIKENYFCRNKFKFGLSEDQVRRLLLLFSLKRLEDQTPPRQLTKSKVARPSGYSTRKCRRVAANDRSRMSNQGLGYCGVDNNHGPVISTVHLGDSFYTDDRATDDGQFGTYMNVGCEDKASAFLNECFQDHMGKVGGIIDAGEFATSDRLDIEWNSGIEPVASVGYSLGNFRSFSNDVRFAKNDMPEAEYYKDDCFESTILKTYPSSLQSKVNPHAYSSKHVLETDSFLHDPTRPSSTFRPSMELQNPNVNYPRTFEDSIVTTSIPYDPDVPSISYQGMSSFGINQGHASSQEYSSHDSFVGNVPGFSKNQSVPSLLETRTTVTLDVNSGSRDFIPLPSSNQCEHSSRTSLPRHPNYEDIASEYPKKERFDDLSLLKPTLPPFPSEIRNNVRMSEQSSSYGTSLSGIPSLMFSNSYPASLQEKNDFQVPEHESNGEFGNNVFMFKECRHHGDFFCDDNRAIEDGRFATNKYVESEHKESQYQLPVHEPANMGYHEVTSLNPAEYQNSECLFPDRQKKRSSVFSRLALPPKVCEQESNSSPGTADINRNTSVNEVMDMLCRSHNHWMKTRPRQSIKQHDNAANFEDKKQAAKKESLTMISKEMNLKPIPFSKENSSRKTEETIFVDFKRRRAVRKNLEDGKTGNCCESLENKSSSASQSKRRKLIRPNFCENESFERGISGDAPENMIASSIGCPVSKNAESIKGSACHVNEDDISQNVKLPNVMCQTAVDGNIEMGSGSNSKQFCVESFIALRSADEDGKESSQNHGISSITSVSCGKMHIEFEQDIINRDLRMDGVFQDRDNVGYSNYESSPKPCEDNGGNGVAKREFLDNIKQVNDISPAGGEMSISNVSLCNNESSPKLCEDSDGNGVAKSKILYNIDQVRDIYPAGGEISINNVSHFNHDSSPKLFEDSNGNGVANNELLHNIEQVNDIYHAGGEISMSNVGHANQESSQKLCEDNDGDGVAKREFSHNIEQVNDIYPAGGEISISNVGHFNHESSPKLCEDRDRTGVAKSEFLHNDEQVSGIYPASGDIAISNAGHSNHESSPKLCEDRDGNGIAKREFSHNIEQVHDIYPAGGEISISNVGHSNSKSSPKLCEERNGNGVAKSEFVYNNEQASDIYSAGCEIYISNLN